MSDLSNLLGAVYGSNDPDGPSTPHEPSAAERTAQPAAPRIDDDLAAALSAALVTSTPEANVGTPAPIAPAPPTTYAAAPAYAPAPAPVAPTMAAAPEPQPAYSPNYNPGMAAWSAGDDDIFPTVAGKKR
jgi:hypothetical protein